MLKLTDVSKSKSRSRRGGVMQPVLWVIVVIAVAVLGFLAGRSSSPRHDLVPAEPDSAAPAELEMLEEKLEKAEETIRRQRRARQSHKSPQTSDEELPPASEGEEVSNKTFAFKVIGVDSLKAEAVSADNEALKPEGVFYLVKVEVRNSAKVPATPLPSTVRLVDLDGYHYEPSGKCAALSRAYSRFTCVLGRELQPGRQRSGVLVFDVPTLDNSYRLEIYERGEIGPKTAEIYL